MQEMSAKALKLGIPLSVQGDLTYRCNDNCAHCYNGRPRDYPEISTEQWKQIIDRLWAIGIPHIVFTGGEPTLRERERLRADLRTLLGQSLAERFLEKAPDSRFEATVERVLARQIGPREAIRSLIEGER